jgi:hypothetical protein
MGVCGWIREGIGKVFLLSCAMAAGLVCVGPSARMVAQAPMAKTTLTVPPAPLLPDTLGKWKRVADGDSGDGLPTVDAADATVLKEDGLKRFARSDYADGGEHGNVAVYQFIDASGAIAAFDYLKKSGMRAEKVGDEAMSNSDELLMRSGKNVVVTHTKLGHAQTNALMPELIDHLPKALGTTGIAPLLPSLLPAKGLDPESVRYALGPQSYKAMGGTLPADAVGFDKSAETVTAKYKGAGTLTLAIYPTPQIAGDHARDLEAAIKQVSDSAGTVMIRREGPLVAVTTGPWSAASAKAMVEGIHLRSEVSFDKPMPLEFKTEVQKTYTLLESIAIFSGVGALAAIFLGFFLGFGRAAIRVLQGKPAATEPEFLRIDLRGSGGKSLRHPEA